MDGMTGDVKLEHETPAEFLGRLGRVGRLQLSLGRVRACIDFLRGREGAEELALLADAEALAGRLSEALAREMGPGDTSVGAEAQSAAEGLSSFKGIEPTGHTTLKAVDISTGSA